MGSSISIKKEQRHSEDEEELSGGESDISEQTNQTEHSDTSSSVLGVNAVERIKPTTQSSSSTSPLSNPPSERKATSYISVSIKIFLYCFSNINLYFCKKYENRKSEITICWLGQT